MKSAILSVALVLAASAPAGVPQGSVGQVPVLKKTALLSTGSSSKRHRGDSVRFGPKGCVSTWLNDQARCMIKTDCTEKDIDNYNFKFICVDEGGEHVRHVFGKGSFDQEETFDTLVTCTACTADADDLMVSAKQQKGNNNTKTSGGPTSTNALLREIVADVGELKVEMANASKNVERLNAAVFKESTAAPPAPAATEAPQEETPAPEETTPAPSSLVHRGASALRAKGMHAKASRMNAIKAHAKASKSHTHKIRRRHTEDDADAADQEDTQDRNGRVDDDSQDGTYVEESAQGQDDSDVQDDSQDHDDARRQDDSQQQEDDDQADTRDADSDVDQRDDEARDDDRSADSDRGEDDGERDADDNGRGEEGADQ